MSDIAKPWVWQVSAKQRTRARALRVNSTEAERVIWSSVRAHRMNGASFRRQAPIGPYIVDFACHDAKVVIELDGGQHFESRHERRDMRRDAFLASKGFRVLRFNNYDVMTNREGVLEAIAAAVAGPPSLSLQPKSDVSDFGRLIIKQPNSATPEFGCKRGRGPWGAARRSLTCALIALLAVTLSAPAAHAQDYPTRPVKIIVPFPAGGTADVMPRIIADWLTRHWGQPVVIENRTGAAGNIGAEAVAKAEPDGYTLLSAPPPPLVINQNLYPKLGYDPTEFVPIVIMGRVPNALVVNPKVPFHSVPELIAYAKANPGKVTSATQGNGTTSHLTSEMFQMMAQVKFQHVPYRGSAPALTDLVGGSVDIMFDNLGVSLPLVRDGKLKLIAVATRNRMAALPDVPTIAETLPGFESAAWFAIVAPPKTPQAIAEKINADVNTALRDPDVLARLAQLSAEPIGGTTAATGAYMREEIERWRNVITAAHVKLE